MTDLQLTGDQRQYLELARDFTLNEIARRSQSCDHDCELPLDVCRQAWEIGLLNVRVPEQFGGLGLSLFDSCVIFEELGAGCTGISAAFEGNELFAAPLLVAGSDEQKKKFLAPLTNEFALAGYCFAGTNSSGAGECAEVRVQRSGSDFVLNAEQCLALNAGYSSWLFVLAAGSDESFSAFIVPAQASGVKVGPPVSYLGRHAADFRHVSFTDVAVEKQNLLGKEGDGLTIARLAREITQPIIGAEAVGIARASFENALRYSKERTTFGQPISSYQAISFMLADMIKEVEAARLLCWKAAWLADHGRASSSQSLIAKTYAADIAVKAATDAVQIYGGYGYSREYPVEKLMRDAKMFQIFEGTSQMQRVQLGRELLAAGGQRA